MLSIIHSLKSKLLAYTRRLLFFKLIAGLGKVKFKWDSGKFWFEQDIQNLIYRVAESLIKLLLGKLYVDFIIFTYNLSLLLITFNFVVNLYLM